MSGKCRRVDFDEEVDRILRAVCLEIAARYKIIFVEIGADKDHVHFLVQSVPGYSPTKIVRTIKSITARLIFNGNGKIDVPSLGEGEMTLDPGRRVDVTGYGGSEWVDEKGTIWFSTFLSASGYYGDIVKLPLQGFDETNNPIYDWTKRETVIPRDASETAFGANYLRIAANGEIWMLGNSKPNGANGVFAFGGNTVARFDEQGRQLAMFPINKQAAGLMPDSEGRFFIAYSEGSGHWVEYRGADGEILATARPGEKSGPNPGWIDHPYGFYAFIHNGVRYAYAEDVMYGKSIRYRFDNG